MRESLLPEECAGDLLAGSPVVQQHQKIGNVYSTVVVQVARAAFARSPRIEQYIEVARVDHGAITTITIEAVERQDFAGRALGALSFGGSVRADVAVAISDPCINDVNREADSGAVFTPVGWAASAAAAGRCVARHVVSVPGTTGREANGSGQLLAGCPNAAGALQTCKVVAMCRGAHPSSVAGTF